MEEKIFCWHASFSSLFNFETFGTTFNRDSFSNNIYNYLKQYNGINGYVLFIVDFYRGTPRMYFSKNQKLYEITNLMAYDYRDMKVIDKDSNREIFDQEILTIRDYISCVLIGKNVGGINQRIQIGKSLSFLEINFDKNIIDPYMIQCILKKLFEEQYSDFSIEI